MKRFLLWAGTWFSAACVAGAWFVLGMIWARQHPDETPCTQSAYLSEWKPTKPAGKLKYQCVWERSNKNKPYEPYCVWEEDYAEQTQR